MNDSDIAELKQAYGVLGLPYAASAHTIKRAHRALLKRWHPDLYVSGTQGHDEAARMAKTINEAYSRIERAPLRYYVEPSPKTQRESARNVNTSAGSGRSNDEHLPRIERIEFWVRFVCGAGFGVLLSFNLALQFFSEASPRSFGLASLALTFACGFGAARLGDRFWQSILARWWLWS